MQITYRDIGIAVVILLLAFLVRTIVVFDRAANDPAFDPLPYGSDQRTYLIFARGYENGTWPDGPFWYQPGLTYYFVGIRLLTGDSLGMMRLMTGVTGALACGFMVGVGWLLTQRKWGGYLAGLLLALYPVAAFYATVLLIPGLATFLVVVFLLLMLWQREERALWRTLALGLVLGLTTITRTNLALLWLAWLLFLLLYAPTWRARILHGGLSLLALALMVAPVTLYNRQQGSAQLVTRVGMEEIYRASSRDATGTYISRYPAYELVDNGQYAEALLHDLRYDPLHFIQLQIRKLSLYWSALEPANNIDYIASGENASPLLRFIPLDFRILSAAGLLGLLALWYADRRMAAVMTVIVLLMFAGVMIIWVEGRVRQPVVAPLVATSAYLVVHLAGELRSRDWRRLARRWLLPVAALVLIFAYFDWAVNHLPQQRPVTDLPADVRPLEITFDDTLQLVGWRPMPFWPAAVQGWTHPDRSYVIEFYWRLLQPTDVDYNAYAALVLDETRYAARDTVIGEIRFRHKPTSTWEPGDIYREVMGFTVPPAAPTARSIPVRMGVYRTEGTFTYEQDTRQVIPVAVTQPANHTGDVVIQHLAVFAPDMDFAPPPAGMPPSDLVFGDVLALRGLRLPAPADPTMGFAWEALANIDQNYNLFVHIMDEADSLVAQYDGPLNEGNLLTANWPPGYTTHDTIEIDLPQQPGTYRVFIGLYERSTRDRASVDAPDNRPLVGEIVVGGG